MRVLRRSTVLTFALAVLAAACTKSSGGPTDGQTAARGSIEDLSRGAQQLSVIEAQSTLTTGKNLFTFGLSTSKGGLLTGGSPQVYVAPDRTSKATGPFPGTWETFTAYQKTGDHSPRTPLPGFYWAEVDVASAGNWFVAVVVHGSSGNAVGQGAMAVTAHPQNAIGSKAISVATPVATTLAKEREIDTRQPPDPMHYVSLDRALANGKPTVVVFSTPLLCESRMCGPATDETLLAFRQVGAAKANFIHVEEFLPGPDLKPPAATLANQSPGFKAWHLTTEPWVFVIDKHGIIRARFEGPVVAPQILAALRPLL